MTHGIIHDAIPIETNSKSRSKQRGFVHYCPSFFYVLLIFIALRLATTDFQGSLHLIGEYRVYWLLIIIVATIAAILFDLRKVYEPKTNNVREVNWISNMSYLYILLYGMAVVGTGLMWAFGQVLPDGAIATLDKSGWYIGTVLDHTFRLFNNTEFLGLTILNFVWKNVANSVNANTLQTQIGQTSPG